ncbi:MAG: hypothetical protein IPK26_31950 [Planctomycetes bacterium]|nr:hypothetical protein [Planctomycetota bacterium]
MSDRRRVAARPAADRDGRDPQLPAQPSLLSHAPFASVGRLRAAGTIDLDGNDLPDAWFLGDAPGTAEQLRFAMGREQCAGRFRDWPRAFSQPTPIADAATLRIASVLQDQLLTVHPSVPGIGTIGFDLPATANPHAAGTFLHGWLAQLPPLTNLFEIETGNHDGEACDDLAVLLDAGALGSVVVKFRLDAPWGLPTVAGIARADVPLPMRRLRLLDWDRDGRSDVAAEVPGLGVVIGRDDGAGNLVFAAFVPSQGRTLVDLTTGPMLATVTAYRCRSAEKRRSPMASRLSGAMVRTDRSHWLPGPGDALGGAALLEADADHVVLAALPAAGNRLLTQVLFRRGGALPAATAQPSDPIAYWGAFTSCGTFVDDLDGDGDRDLWLQHPDGASWYPVRNASRSLAPELLRVTHDASLSASGWYLESHHVRVPAGWDFQAFPDLELQVMLEDPFGIAQFRWDRLLRPIDPVTRQVTFTVAWQENAQTTAAFMQNRNLLPPAFAQAGYATAGRRTQLHICACGPGNWWFNDAERRGEPLLLYHDPGGSANKSAQGVLWEKRPAPPLPRADQTILPWN